MRLALFVGVAGILYLLGMRDLLLLAVALLVSGLLSFTLLSDQRDQMSAALAARKAALDERNAERTAAEDAANDAMREAQEARLAGTAAADVRRPTRSRSRGRARRGREPERPTPTPPSRSPRGTRRPRTRARSSSGSRFFPRARAHNRDWAPPRRSGRPGGAAAEARGRRGSTLRPD